MQGLSEESEYWILKPVDTVNSLFGECNCYVYAYFMQSDTVMCTFMMQLYDYKRRYRQGCETVG